MERQNEQIRELVNNAAGNRETIELLNSRVRERDNRISELSRNWRSGETSTAPTRHRFRRPVWTHLPIPLYQPTVRAAGAMTVNRRINISMQFHGMLFAVSMSGQGWIFLGEEQGRSGH